MPSNLFHHNELNYYEFGLQLGLTNILRNGWQLGPEKTAGKILQPINSYTRFPEYYFMERCIVRYLRAFGPPYKASILDIGSPKCFGLYLASHFEVEIHLTDIYRPAVEEAQILWKGIAGRAKGNPIFSVQDARRLQYSAEHFDVVYAMSVVEHIEGEAGDSDSVREMLRVLKPGGLLLVTVPFGQKYVEQDRIGFQGAAIETGQPDRYFFQRVYTPAAIETRINGAVGKADLRMAVTISRKTGLISKLYGRLGPRLRGLLGCLNPILSTALNDSKEGILPVIGDYGDVHSPKDIYGDLVLAWEKPTTHKSETLPREARHVELAATSSRSASA